MAGCSVYSIVLFWQAPFGHTIPWRYGARRDRILSFFSQDKTQRSEYRTMGPRLYRASEFVKAHIREQYKRFEIEKRFVSGGLNNAKFVVATNVYNERDNIEFFLDYYRSLGIKEFIVLDNNSTDGILDFLRDKDGISLFYTSHKYKKARYGIDWMNVIFNQYCIKKWIIYVDCDEFLVYPYQDVSKIEYLINYLERNNYSAMSCTMIDVYSKNKISKNICNRGSNPMEICNFFDKTGYLRYYDTRNNVEWVKGGVRGRQYFPDDPEAGPALNKIPVIFWKPWYAYIKSTHELTPSYLNKIYSDKDAVSGALIHTKFTSKFLENISDSKLIANHTTEYRNYADDQKDISFFKDGVSKEFIGWKSLHEEGLIQLPRNW